MKFDLSPKLVGYLNLIEQKVQDDSDAEIFGEEKETKQDNITITSPFKSKKNTELSVLPKHKTQLKLTKMQNYTFKKSASKENEPHFIEETRNEPKNIEKTREATRIDLDQKSWKVKAVIDNKNFLIPISYAVYLI